MLRRADGSFSYLADRNLFVPQNDLSVGRYGQSQVVEAQSQHPDAPGQAFQDAHIVFGPGGDHYAVSSDGHLRKFAASGKLLEELPLPGADGAPREMFTLSEYFARDRVGRIYVSHAGSVYVVESSAHAPAPRAVAGLQSSAGRRALDASLASTTDPGPVIDVAGWVVGTWDCAGFSGYFNVKEWPGAHLQRVVATYTVTDVAVAGQPGLLHGEYRELTTSDGSMPASFDETWSVDAAAPDKTGRVPASIETTFSNGAHVRASGTVGGQSGVVLGTSSFSGQVTFAGGGSNTWSGGITAISGPDHFAANYRIGIAPGVQQGYHQLTCERRGL